jgi:hypothetical protein
MERLSNYYEEKPKDLNYTKCELGRINSVKFGLIDDYPFLWVYLWILGMAVVGLEIVLL